MNKIICRKLSHLLSAAVLISAVGCGGESIKPIRNIAECEGTITYDGKPLPTGTVMFAPADIRQGQSAVGKIINGKFTMMTTASSPGVVQGKYRVRIDGSDPSKPQPMPEPGKKQTVESVIPAKYTSIATSGLEVDVTKGMAPLKLDLKRE